MQESEANGEMVFEVDLSRAPEGRNGRREEHDETSSSPAVFEIDMEAMTRANSAQEPPSRLSQPKQSKADGHGAMIKIAPKSLAQAEGFNVPLTEPDEAGLFL